MPYYGKVDEDGTIHLPKKMRAEIAGAFKGARIEVIVKKAYKQRSSEQNRYYWGVLIPFVLRMFIEAGAHYQEDNREHIELVEELMRRKFGLWESIPNPNGEEEKVLVRLSKYSTVQQEELNAEIRLWALEFFNYRIPLPNEQLTIYGDGKDKQ